MALAWRSFDVSVVFVGCWLGGGGGGGGKVAAKTNAISGVPNSQHGEQIRSGYLTLTV